MIQQKIEDLTKQIWENINLSNHYNTIYGEETITDSILLQLAKHNFSNIKIIQTPKFLESKIGTDWEWYVGTHQYGWIRFAIQAKKMNIKTNIYKSLNHKVGININKKSQISILEKFAKTNKVIPLYSFYNHYPKANKKDHWHCHKPFEKELLGWTFTPLSNIKKAIQIHGGKNFDKIHQYKETLPMRCLFSCSYFLNQYKNQKIIGKPSEFLGESFHKIGELPRQFINAIETRKLTEFPKELYDSEIGIYPKKIAIIRMNE